MLYNHPLIQGSARQVAALLVLVSVYGTVGAEEIRYVSDQIVLKMYQDSALSKTLSPLKSGDRVKVLKRDDGYAQVKLKDGTKGWVKSSYLEKEKPAIIKLEEVQEELDSLKSKHTDLLLEQTEPVNLNDSELMQRVETAEAARDNLQKRVNELETQNTRQVEELRQLKNTTVVKQEKSRNIILWIILPLLTLITGFFIGYKYLETKVKARFGGYNPV